MTPRPLIPAVIAVAAMSVALAAQAGRGVSASVGTDARTVSELATADLLVLVPRAGTTVFLAERTIVEALGARRGIVLSFAILGRAVEEPLSHFLLGHVTEDELRLEA